MFKARPVLDQNVLLTLYNSFVYPYLIYCIEIWGTASQTHLQPLFLAQKKVVRIITFSHYLAHTQPLFQSLLILPVAKSYFVIKLVLLCISIAMVYSQTKCIYVKHPYKMVRISLGK